MQLIFTLLAGLILGSFVNVLIWRIPKGFSVVGRSFCPKCQKKIVWFDNIPLLSFILLKGKCRSCKKKIALRYPLVELLFGVVTVLLYLKFGLTLKFFFYVLLSIVLLSILVIDFMHQIIPDELVFIGLIISVLFIFSFANLFAGFLAASFLLILHLITKGKGMGLGDVKFAILGGMIVGLTNIFSWFLVAFLTGAIVGCILILTKKSDLKSKIAFGPFLVLALLYEILFQIRI